MVIHQLVLTFILVMLRNLSCEKHQSEEPKLESSSKVNLTEQIQNARPGIAGPFIFVLKAVILCTETRPAVLHDTLGKLLTCISSHTDGNTVYTCAHMILSPTRWCWTPAFLVIMDSLIYLDLRCYATTSMLCHPIR